MRSNAKKVMFAIQKRLDSALKEMPKALANEGQRFFMENFRKESWEGKRWRPRIAKSGKNSNNPLLIGRTRRLKNAVNNSIKEASMQRIKWGVYLEYAAIHNNGFKGVEYVRAHKRRRFGTTKVADITKQSIKTRRFATRKVRVQTGKINVKSFSRKMNMPKRQFMGVSKTLRTRLVNRAMLIIKSRMR